MSDEKLRLSLHAACDLLETMGVRSPKIREWRMLAGVRCFEIDSIRKEAAQPLIPFGVPPDPRDNPFVGAPHARCSDCDPARACFFSTGSNCMKAATLRAAPELARCGSCDWTFGCFNGGARCQKDPSNVGPLPLPPPEEP